MYNLHSHLQEYREAGALHTLVALDSVVDDHLFITKSGDLVAFLKFRGIDPECLDLADKETVARRFEAAHRPFDERFRVYQYLFKHEHLNLSAGAYANPVVNEAVQNRLRHFNQRAEPLYSVDTALAVVYEGWREGHGLTNPRVARGLLSPLLKALSVAEKGAALSESLDQARELVMGKVNAFVTQVRDFLDIEILGKEAAFQIQRRLLNYANMKCDYARLTGHHFVDYQACGSHLECHRNFLRLDDDYIAVLTLKEPPPQTYAMMLANLESLPCPFVVVSEWRRWESGKVRRLIQSRRRHFHNSKSSLGAQLSTGTQSGSADVLVDNAAVAMVGNLGACLEELDFKGRHFGEYSLSIMLSGRDLAALRRAVAQCLKTFAAHDAELTEEGYNRLSAWLAGQPGNSAFNLRRMVASECKPVLGIAATSVRILANGEFVYRYSVAEQEFPRRVSVAFLAPWGGMQKRAVVEHYGEALERCFDYRRIGDTWLFSHHSPSATSGTGSRSESLFGVRMDSAKDSRVIRGIPNLPELRAALDSRESAAPEFAPAFQAICKELRPSRVSPHLFLIYPEVAQETETLGLIRAAQEASVSVHAVCQRHAPWVRKICHSTKGFYAV